MAEESVLSDLARVHGRRTFDNGVTVDFSPLREFGLTLSFRSRSDGSTEFVDFIFVAD